MKLIKKIHVLLKKIFQKNNIKMISTIQETEKKEEKNQFIDSLKIDQPKATKKNKVETLTCVGDGLGINNKISY